MQTKDVIAQFNVVARTEYNKSYKEFEPEFKSLMFEYQSGPVESMSFPYFEFLTGMEEFTGSRKHQTFPEGYTFQVLNKEWDMAVDIKMKDLDRAAASGGLKGLNPYRQRIAEMPKLVKDHPVELAFDMIEAGAGNTYGTCFDQQNLFDTTHNYGPSAGTQSNILTGTGVTVAALGVDLKAALQRLNSFYYFQGGNTNTKKRKLNSSVSRPLVIAPDDLYSALWDLQNQDRLPDNSTNTLRGRFDFVTRPFADANDWYVALNDETMFRPILHQVEKAPMLDTPTPSDEAVRERKIMTWGAYGRYNNAYGAWWKIAKTTNA